MQVEFVMHLMIHALFVMLNVISEDDDTGDTYTSRRRRRIGNEEENTDNWLSECHAIVIKYHSNNISF